jgi:hypothetical protein
MKIWRITPAARFGDSRWEDHPMFAEVIVRAGSAAEARLLAGTGLSRAQSQTQFGGERDTIFISAFRDPSLYRVVELAEPSGHPAEGSAEIIAAQEMPAPAVQGFGL